MGRNEGEGRIHRVSGRVATLYESYVEPACVNTGSLMILQE